MSHNNPEFQPDKRRNSQPDNPGNYAPQQRGNPANYMPQPRGPGRYVPPTQPYEERQVPLQPPRAGSMPRPEHPFAVSFTAILIGLVGAFYLFVTMFGLCILGILQSITNPFSNLQNIATSIIPGATHSSSPPTTLADSISGLNSMLTAIVYFTVLGLLHLYIARGLWTIQRWSYWAAIGLQVVAVILALLFLLPTGNIYFLLAAIYVPIILLIYFLLSPSVRQAFNQ